MGLGYGAGGKEPERTHLGPNGDPHTPQITTQMPASHPLGPRPPYLLDFQGSWARLQSLTEAGEAWGLQLTLSEAVKSQRAEQGSERALPSSQEHRSPGCRLLPNWPHSPPPKSPRAPAPSSLNL